MKEFCAGMPWKWVVVGNSGDSAFVSKDWEIDWYFTLVINKVNNNLLKSEDKILLNKYMD